MAGGKEGPALGGSCRNAVLENTSSPQQTGLATAVLTCINKVKYGRRETFRSA